jgi:hypothetical protein
MDLARQNKLEAADPASPSASRKSGVAKSKPLLLSAMSRHQLNQGLVETGMNELLSGRPSGNHVGPVHFV